ncbi:hypothetical protein P3S68_011104 [Capsicum galapagoense]
MLSQNDDVLELEEVGELEEQVNEMAEKIADYRRTISVQLKTTVSSILIAQRPVLVTRFNEGSESQSGSSGDPSSDVGGPIESGYIALLAGEEQRVQLLKQKILENASAIPVVLTRMKECMKRIDKLQPCDGVIHPAFKRKRTF